MSEPKSLDERIGRLAPAVDGELSEELRQALRTLRRADSPLSVLLMMSRASLRLFRLIYAAAGKPWPSDNLFDVIIKAANGDPEKKVDGYRILPDKLDSPLHALRVLSNQADHGVEKFKLGAEFAESVLNALLGVMRWYYCEAAFGERIPSLYAAGAADEEVGFTLRIGRDLDTYTDAERQYLLTAIGALLKLNEPVTVVRVARGSVLLTVRLRRSEAEELARLIDAGKLEEYGVIGWVVEREEAIAKALAEEGSWPGFGFDSPATWPGLDDQGPDVIVRRSEDSLPESVGRYQFVGPLGAGGLSNALLARDHLGRKMVLKSSRTDVGNALLRAEVLTLASLNHPNIVRLLDSVEFGGQTHAVLELLDGGDLASRLSEHPLAAEDAATLLKTLAQAMAYASSQGVIHRNLKPSAIRFTADGEPKIISWGIALSAATPPSLKENGAPIGTPAYMAPEQARGENSAVGPTTDVFGLGAVLYECLVGAPPFRAATISETLARVINADPVAPSRLSPNVPRDLEAICLKCLQTDPNNRYASAGELADELGLWLNGEPIKARPAGPVERAWKWVARTRLPLTLAAAAAILISALGFVGGAGYQRMADRPRAVRPPEPETLFGIAWGYDADDARRLLGFHDGGQGDPWVWNARAAGLLLGGGPRAVLVSPPLLTEGGALGQTLARADLPEAALASDGVSMSWTRSGATLLLTSGGGVAAIVSAEPTARTARGVRVGSPEGRITALYPGPHTTEDRQDGKVYRFDGLGIGFETRDGAVMRITLYRPRVPAG